MARLACPHCGGAAISIARKLTLGPARPATCKACGGRVAISYPGMLAAALPFIVALIAASFIEPGALRATIWIAGLVAMGMIDLFWLPLTPR